MSGKFINFNRNKRSIVLDLKKPDGLAALLRLIARADVFVSNVRPEALARAGLDHASLAADNPRLIHCSILAFGRGGRYYNRPAYDPIIQSLSGVAGTIARATGEPRFVPMVMSDHTSGLIAAQCIGFALYRREKTGRGEAIDVPMLENMASFVSSEHHGRRDLRSAGRPERRRPAAQPRLPSAADQGRLHHRPAQHQRARPSPSSTRSAGPSSRPTRASTAPRRAPTTPPPTSRSARQGLAQKTTDEWLEHLRQARRAGGALQFDRRPADRSASHRCRLVLHRGASERRPRPPDALANSFSGGARQDATCTPPRLGEHTREILAEAGYGEAEIEAMVKSGAARSAF